jgi:hypothetical protein
LQACKLRFEQIGVQREELLNELNEARRHYQPGQMNPSSVLANKDINRLLGQLHQLIDQDHENTEAAGRILSAAIKSRAFWKPLLERRLQAGERRALTRMPPDLAVRMQQWLIAASRLDKEGAQGFAKALLGDSFGPLVLSETSLETDGPAPLAPSAAGNKNMNAMGSLSRELNDLDRQRWLVRLERLERRQETLARMMEHQRQEIERLRALFGACAGSEKGPNQLSSTVPGYSR